MNSPQQVKCIVPASMRKFTQDHVELSYHASSVLEAINCLVDEFPQLKPHLLDQEGRQQPFVNFFLNNKQITDINSANTELPAGAELLIVSALAGG